MSQPQPAIEEADLSPTQLAALRRKKNADAQAAFRSRRANYIANLEETVTRLEYVVRQLQDSCREARDVAEETKQENLELRATINSMRQAERERERVWRALNNRTNPQQSLSDASSDTDGSLVPASVSSCQQTLNGMVMHDNAAATHNMIEYQQRLGYPQPGELPVHQLPSPADTMNALPGYDAYGSTQNMMMSSSSYSVFSSEPQHHGHDGQWSGSSMHSNGYMDNIDADPAPMTCSPGSQIIIPELTEDGTIEQNAMVRFHDSPSLAATFDPSVAMRHPSTPASDHSIMEATQTASPDPQTPRRLTRSRAQFRRTQSGSDPYPTPGSSADRESRRERRRARDSTPDGPAFSDTLAVIKAQAFGTARKTRTRANRGVSEHAARVAMEVLEARGLSLGVSLDGANERRRRRSTRTSESDE
ncbi:hypothetical protein RhiJN_19393 [Ceratobasidium sp. AG-Ba]|nr:hypothetical protein RhiJN_04550 [Ceratobasidium sp. AG-Ba]QRV91375.1 hypothetical protein RhiJN_19393 [Ceratobasidium sp. AG-Ba]QRW05437.1 hypothetical protein RhiLY_04436 [Ceratobasidium sp. AG-Ba]